MSDPEVSPSEWNADLVRAQIVTLLAWANDELDLLSSSFRGCTEADLEEIRLAQGVPRLPEAYREFMHRMGRGGVGSAMAEIFPGDDIAFDSVVPADDWLGVSHAAAEILNEYDVTCDLGEGALVIRTFRVSELDYIPIDGDNPPVYGVHGPDGPVQLVESFTDWLERQIGKAIKRRYPLRSSHLPKPSTGNDQP